MDGKQIRKIAAEGLHYLDDNGTEQFIDFLVCYQNFVRRNTTPEALKNVKEWNHMNDDSLKEYVKRLSEWRVVAGRNFDGSPDASNPYIEFYTEPPTRVQFNTQYEVYQVIHLLKNAGWRTTDLT